jgi:uncharacterized OsmC-like protein
MKATIESLGGVASRVRIGSHELTFDQTSAAPGGMDRGPSPLDVLAVSAAACAHYYAAAFMFARKIPVEGLRVDVEADKTRDPVPRFGRITIRVTLPVGFPEDYLPAIDRAIRHCPAYGTLTHLPLVELEVYASDPAPKVTAA